MVLNDLPVISNPNKTPTKDYDEKKRTDIEIFERATEGLENHLREGRGRSRRIVGCRITSGSRSKNS